MRNALAWIIAIAAAISLAPSVLDFFHQTQLAYNFDNTSMLGGAWLSLGRALVAPVGLFAMAAIVEMLFRISERLPAAASPAAPSRWLWRNNIAKMFLIIAAVAYAASSWAMYQYFVQGVAGGVTTPPSERAQFTISLIFYWLTGPLEIVAMAATIEYLSRISSGMRRGQTEG